MDVYKYGTTGRPMCVDGQYLCTTITPSGEISVYKTGETGNSLHVDDAGRLVITINPDDVVKYKMESFTSEIDGMTSVFSLSYSPINNTPNVYLNGLLLDIDNEEYVISGNQLIMNIVPKSIDSLRVEYFYK